MSMAQVVQHTLENIDGYVSKDNLYRMLSNFRTMNTLTEHEEDMLRRIVEAIKNMPNEIEENESTTV